MLPQPPVIGDRPTIGPSHGKLKDERVISHFDWGARSIIGRRKNLNARVIAPPRTLNAEATETVLAPNFHRPSKDRRLDLLAYALPLGGIERRARFYGHYLLSVKGQRDSTQVARDRKI
jgi:hypothetical protein